MPYKVHYTPDAETLALLADGYMYWFDSNGRSVPKRRGYVAPYTATWPDDFDTWEAAEEAIEKRGGGPRHLYSITYVGLLDDLGEFKLDRRGDRIFRSKDNDV
jgi:hypothetical protein